MNARKNVAISATETVSNILTDRDFDIRPTTSKTAANASSSPVCPLCHRESSSHVFSDSGCELRIHKGPAWARPGDPANRPRTAIRLDLHGHKSGVVRDRQENRIRQSDFARMSPLQRLFAHASIVDDASIEPSQRKLSVGA